mgnify:FL=1
MRRLYPLSPTKAGVWLDCRYRFFLQYVARVPRRGSWAHLSMGNAIHGVLRDAFDLPAAARTPEGITAMMTRQWSDEGFHDPQQSRHWRDRAAEMTERYLGALDPQFEPRSREQNLGARTEAITITGRIDRLDERADGSVVVVDYKTGRSVPDEDEARSSMALAAYALCVRQSLRRPCHVVELHHIPSGSVASWEHTDDTLARHLERIDRVGREMAAAEAAWTAGAGEVSTLFPASPGPLCGWCDYREECVDGQRAAERRDPWAGLPTD